MQKPKKNKPARAVRESNGTHPASHIDDFNARFDRLCLRLGVPLDGSEWSRWALVALTLARGQPEFKKAARGRGRGRSNELIDEKILDVIETVMRLHPSGFKEVFNKVIKAAIKSGWLPPWDRTAHPKRLKRAWHNRQKNRGDVPTMASILRGCWDK